MIDGKPFFDIPVKSKEKAYEQIIEMSRNNDYTTGNLLKHEDFSEHCKLIAIYLSKQIELENLGLKQQINFIGRRETQKIVNLLNDSANESSKFATRKWYIINDQNNGQYGNAYVLVTGKIKARDGNVNTKAASKNCGR